MTGPIVVRGGGDIATGTIYKLCKSGYPVIILECENPTAIRRKAAFCEAARNGKSRVEDMECRLAGSAGEALERIRQQKTEKREPVMLVDEQAKCLELLKPEILIDGILAKQNLGTTKDMANLVIALGPGFTAGEDCDYVIETMRGHNLGRIIKKGCAAPNTGVPGLIKGIGKERVIHAPAAGIFHKRIHIAGVVKKGQVLGTIEKDGQKTEVTASIDGVLRGILLDGFPVWKGLKMADIDPRISEKNNCYTISDKARCIAGSVLELVVAYEKTNLPG